MRILTRPVANMGKWDIFKLGINHKTHETDQWIILQFRAIRRDWSAEHTPVAAYI